MSTVGKVLVVAQLAFSVLLMGFAAGVGSTRGSSGSPHRRASYAPDAAYPM